MELMKRRIDTGTTPLQTDNSYLMKRPYKTWIYLEQHYYKYTVEIENCN